MPLITYQESVAARKVSATRSNPEILNLYSCSGFAPTGQCPVWGPQNRMQCFRRSLTSPSPNQMQLSQLLPVDYAEVRGGTPHLSVHFRPSLQQFQGALVQGQEKRWFLWFGYSCWQLLIYSKIDNHSALVYKRKLSKWIEIGSNTYVSMRIKYKCSTSSFFLSSTPYLSILLNGKCKGQNLGVLTHANTSLQREYTDGTVLSLIILSWLKTKGREII